MHGRSSLFVTSRLGLIAAKATAGAGACLLLSSCVNGVFSDAQVDPRSPIAAEVAKTVRHGAPYPTFAAFPATPKDVRPLGQYGVAAQGIEAQAAALVKATGPETWTISDAEAFAAQARKDAGPVLPPGDPAATEAAARDLRARAKTPPNK